MRKLGPTDDNLENAMLAFRFGLSLLLGAATLGDPAAFARDDGAVPAAEERSLLARDLDRQLTEVLGELIESARIGPDGDVFLKRVSSDRHFLEPHSGRYWQISGEGRQAFASRSLWDRRLQVRGRKASAEPLRYHSDQFANEQLRVIERTVRLPGSNVEWRFVVARSRGAVD